MPSFFRTIEIDMSLCAVEASECAVIDLMRVHRATLPPVRFDCGTSDVLLPQNRALHAAMEAEHIPHTYEEFPGGHDWTYWQTHLAESLRFFSGNRQPVEACPRPRRGRVRP